MTISRSLASTVSGGVCSAMKGSAVTAGRLVALGALLMLAWRACATSRHVHQAEAHKLQTWEGEGGGLVMPDPGTGAGVNGGDGATSQRP